MTGWLKFPAAQYLDQRHPNWVLAEEFGDVIFSGGVVFVHRARAEHIVRTLLGAREVLLLEAALALPARTGVGGTRVTPPQPRPLVMKRRGTRWRDIVDWLGILAGAGVLVASLAVPLDDAAYAVTLALWLRGLRTVHMRSTSG
jgi:hypothetical protein